MIGTAQLRDFYPELPWWRPNAKGEHSMVSDPREMFDMRLAHVGINAQDRQEAQEIAEQFARLLFLPITTTPISHFADTMVEIMDGGGRGEHGHIGFAVNDVRVAAAWFDAHGYAIDEKSWAYKPDGTARLVYFKEPIAGFAIHLVQA